MPSRPQTQHPKFAPGRAGAAPGTFPGPPQAPRWAAEAGDMVIPRRSTENSGSDRSVSSGAVVARSVVVTGLAAAGFFTVQNIGAQAAADERIERDVLAASNYDRMPLLEMEKRAIREGIASREAKLRELAEKAKKEAEARKRKIAEVNKNPKPYAKQYMADKYGWTGAEWDALEKLWTRESHWRYQADNPTSSAYGIPQMLTGGTHGNMIPPDYKSNAMVQIQVGLSYIKQRYGSPVKAWAHSEKTGWY